MTGSANDVHGLDRGDDSVSDPVSLDGTIYASGGLLDFDAHAGAMGPRPSADASAFREAMSRLASGVVMVTTLVSGRPWGLTVSACCSISVEPPLLLVSLNRQTQSWRAIRSSRRFGVDILAASQRRIAEIGAAVGSPKFVDEFCERQAEGRDAPRLCDALCHFDCDVYATQEVGTHGLVVGRVRAVSCGDPTEPLIYYQRSFRRLGDSAGN